MVNETQNKEIRPKKRRKIWEIWGYQTRKAKIRQSEIVRNKTEKLKSDLESD